MQSAFLKSYQAYLQLERNHAANTVEAYLRDAEMLLHYLTDRGILLEQASADNIEQWVQSIGEAGFSAASQARLISGVKSFFQFLLMEKVITDNPTLLIDTPKLARTLPDVLSVSDIDLLLNTIDMSTPDGQRNRAMLETMYSCGLRVSELTQLALSRLHLALGYIRVIGKGNKERLVPIGSAAVKHIELYKKYVRVHQPIHEAHTDILFLSKHGKALSRVMVFLIIKKITAASGIQKEVHPHTFRHSFATHLVEAGADLRAVQEMLGHASITTTEIYTHLNTTYLHDTMRKYHPRFR